MEIVAKAARIPAKAISDNAGFDGVVIASKLNEMDDTNMGFNAQVGEFVNMFDAGILDPTKVVKTALIDAASVAGLMAMAESAIADLPDDKAGGGGAPDMGGMGGMVSDRAHTQNAEAVSVSAAMQGFFSSAEGGE